MQAAKLTHPIRWIVSDDVPAVAEIDAQGYSVSLGEAGICEMCKRYNTAGMLAEDRDTIRGFMIYSLHKRKIVIDRFCVGACWRRTGVGTAMMDALKQKLGFNGRDRLEITVSERNLASHLFLKASGFVAKSVDRNQFSDGQDGYFFVYDGDGE